MGRRKVPSLPRVRTFRNPHDSAKAAWKAWEFKTSDRGLWGVPVTVGKKIRVYGVNLRTGKCVHVEFFKDKILVMRRRA